MWRGQTLIKSIFLLPHSDWSHFSSGTDWRVFVSCQKNLLSLQVLYLFQQKPGWTLKLLSNIITTEAHWSRRKTRRLSYLKTVRLLLIVFSSVRCFYAQIWKLIDHSCCGTGFFSQSVLILWSIKYWDVFQMGFYWFEISWWSSQQRSTCWDPTALKTWRRSSDVSCRTAAALC